MRAVAFNIIFILVYVQSALTVTETGEEGETAVESSDDGLGLSIASGLTFGHIICAQLVR